MPPDCITRGVIAMFFAQNVYGVARLQDAYHALPIPADKKLRSVSKFLGISERTLSNYLTGKSDPPRAVVYAIWHESPAGHAVTSEHVNRGLDAFRALSKSLQADIVKKDQALDAMALELAKLKMDQDGTIPANDPVYRYS